LADLPVITIPSKPAKLQLGGQKPRLRIADEAAQRTLGGAWRGSAGDRGASRALMKNDSVFSAQRIACAECASAGNTPPSRCRPVLAIECFAGLLDRNAARQIDMQNLSRKTVHGPLLNESVDSAVVF